MPVNLEMKAALRSMEWGEACARVAGGLLVGILQQVDTYFAVSHGRLKLRESQGAVPELIFYEREEVSARRFCRYRKTGIPDGGALKESLGEAVGLLVVVEKERHLYLAGATRIHLDRVRDLGLFIEFEVPVSDGQEAEQTLRKLQEIFEIPDHAGIRKSYADMVLESR